jgi:hypothetical protein
MTVFTWRADTTWRRVSDIPNRNWRINSFQKRRTDLAQSETWIINSARRRFFLLLKVCTFNFSIKHKWSGHGERNHWNKGLHTSVGPVSVFWHQSTTLNNNNNSNFFRHARPSKGYVYSMKNMKEQERYISQTFRTLIFKEAVEYLRVNIFSTFIYKRSWIYRNCTFTNNS